MNKVPIIHELHGYYFYEIYFHEGFKKWFFRKDRMYPKSRIFNKPLDGTELEVFPHLKDDKQYKDAIAYNVAHKV